jgi:hypothetical protein
VYASSVIGIAREWSREFPSAPNLNPLKSGERYPSRKREVVLSASSVPSISAASTRKRRSTVMSPASVAVPVEVIRVKANPIMPVRVIHVVLMSVFLVFGLRLLNRDILALIYPLCNPFLGNTRFSFDHSAQGLASILQWKTSKEPLYE